MTESGDFSVEEYIDLYRLLGPWDDLQNETFARAREYVKLVRSSLRDQPERYKAFTVIMKTIAETRYATEKPPWEDVLGRVKEVLAGYDDLIVGFHAFLPPDAQLELGLRRRTTAHQVRKNLSDVPKERRSNCDDATTSQVQASAPACGAVQELEVPSVKNDEGRVRRSCRAERKRLCLDEEVTVGTSNDKKSKIPSTEDEDTIAISIRQRLSFFRNVKQRIGPSAYSEFRTMIRAYIEGSAENPGLKNRVLASIEDYPDLVTEFDRYVNKTPRICKPLTEESDDICQPLTKENLHSEIPEEYMDLPLWEVALSNPRSVTPSYWRLPDDYPIPLPTHRNKTDAEVLNDRFVSAATACSSGNHDGRRQRRKGQYEKVVSKCEDDRYELHMLKSWLEAAIRYAEDKLEELCADKIQRQRDEDNAEEDPDAEAKRNAKEMERKCFFRCVERMYGDHGLEIHDIIHNNPAKALPTVMSRLKQKLEELKVFLPQMESIWSDRILSKKKS